MANYLVYRRTPDWLTFDIESSREFCRNAGLPENTVVDLAAIWDRTMRLDYRHVRHELKAIAAEAYRAIADATLISLDQFYALDRQSADRFMFVDDDDWCSPRVFIDTVGDAVWGSIFLGRYTYPQKRAEDPPLYKRALDSHVWTNNYIVTGQALETAGLDALMEHSAANRARLESRYKPTLVERYLSCANKHPCCTMAAHFTLPSERFRNDPRGVVAEYVAALDDPLDPDIAWMAGPRSAQKRVFEQCLGG